MNKKSTKDKVVNSTKEITKEIYTDLLKPTTKAIGNIIALPFKAIDAALSPIKKWIDNKNHNYEETRQLLAEKLKNKDYAKIVEPEPYVAVPALQQLEYSYNSEELRELYANLLASSMDSDKKWSVHPSFVDIIKQLSPLDAHVLSILQTKAVFTVICMRIKNIASKAFSDYLIDYCIDLKHLFKEPKMEAASLQNLKRLGIINIRYDQKVQPNSEYDKYSNDNLIIKGLGCEKTNPDSQAEFIHGLIELTDFGYQFCEICCQNNWFTTILIHFPPL